MTTGRALLALAILASTIAATATDARALEDLAHILPPETVVYARCAGYDTLIAELENSRFLRDGSLVAGLYRDNTAKLYPLLKEMTGVPVKVWQEHLKGVKGAHFALFSFGETTEDLDAIGIVEVSDEGRVRELLQKTLGEKSTFAGEVAGAQVLAVETDEITIYYAVHESKLFVTSRPERISTVLGHLAKTPDKSLATRPAYRSGALKSDKGTTFFAFADMPRFFTLLENTMGRYVLRFYNEFDKVVMLDGLKTACVTSGMGHCRGRAIVDPDHPWLDAFRGTVGPTTLTSYLPPNTFFAFVDSGDIPEKWKKLKKHLTSNRFPYSMELEQGFSEAQKMLGSSLTEIAATMGTEWAWFVPMGESDQFDEDYMIFAFRIGDREKFDAILTKFLESPIVKDMEKSGMTSIREEYAGVEIIRGSREGRDDAPCMAIVDDNLFFSGHVGALKAAIDAKTTGEGMLARSARYLEGLPRAPSKFGTLSLPMMLREEREWVPLLDIVHDDAILAAAASEDPGRIELFGNGSLPAFVALLASGEFLHDKYREERRACVHNLGEIGKAIKKYREANEGHSPPSLTALVPDYLADRKLLVCPFDHGKEGVTCSYEHVLGLGKPGQTWDIDAWCPHRRHGRIALRRGGDAYSTSESSFERTLRRMERQHAK
ncbi:MAG: hypothetical protein ABFS86_14510 [Planctomycetota bacterium]